MKKGGENTALSSWIGKTRLVIDQDGNAILHDDFHAAAIIAGTANAALVAFTGNGAVIDRGRSMRADALVGRAARIDGEGIVGVVADRTRRVSRQSHQRRRHSSDGQGTNDLHNNLLNRMI